jgi:superfamily II DNA or RNA helicase
MFTELNLQITYRSCDGNIVDLFYNPCLKHAVSYKRAVGYFTSSGLSAAAKGLASFLAGSGRMYLIASPHISQADAEAIQKGYSTREQVVTECLLRAFPPTVDDLIKNRLGCLAWLIAQNRLEIKIALPCAKGNSAALRGLYHEKIGVFVDEIGNRIAFTGSANETEGGLVNNFESIDVFWSWNDPQKRVDSKELSFERMWDNETERLEILPFPDAARQKLLTYKPEHPALDDPESSTSLSQNLQFSEAPLFQARDYQLRAIEAWFKAGCRGILAMATGSGKTKTALAAAKRTQVEWGKPFLGVVVAPYKHLAEQWAAECAPFAFRTILCYSENGSWEREALQLRTSFLTRSLSAAVLVTTYATFISDRFQQTLARLPQGKLLIADEVHHLGAEASRIPLDGFEKRLGLSATPERIYDPEGTNWLLENVGPIVFRFGLDQAIGRCLTPYRYYVHSVYLDDGEQQAFQEVMHQIALACATADALSEENPEANCKLGALLRKRQEILGGAKGKLPTLKSILQSQTGSKSYESHSLFYASSSLFNELIRLLSVELYLKIAKFTFEESMEMRRQILSDFSSQRIAGIVAKKCLDEGMDIPATRNAFILCSSSNPMEFIQRRGRVLRQFPGKDEAIIHDFFVLPNPSYKPNVYDQRLVERELKRVIEFASFAKNGVQSREQILPIQKQYNLLHM